MQDKPVALVTGANQGIGLQIAKDLVAHGFTVLVGSRNLERGEAAARKVGPDARAIQLDVTDQASIAAAAERIRKEIGRLDVLINNAAISNTSKLPGTSIAEYAKLTRPSNVSLDEVRAVWETNVFGVLAVTQAMLPILRKAPVARIVNVSSGVGSLTMNSDPASPWRSIFGPVYPCVQDSSQRDNARPGDRAGVDRDQGQRRLPRLHQDEPQQLCRHRDCRGGCCRGGARRPARSGRADRNVHACKTRNAPLVIRLAREKGGLGICR
jgi:NAD(P)-dependent dehydrogenase (short-subunit alcohol dehydrogenase family)